MKKLRKISQGYYLRQIMACWMILSMAAVMPVQIAMAVETPGAGVLPSGIINSTGINAPVIDGLNMDITQTAGQAIINWNNFDIGANAGVKFIQPGSAAAVLNRVHDGDVTGIMGSLTANGRVFIINPAGIVFGEGAVVNVSQLVASSLNITDDDFMNGVFKFAGGGGMVSNYGQITAEHVALIGGKVLNAGVIEAPAGTVIMAAGEKVFLGVEGSDVIVEVAGITLPDTTDAEFKDGDVINEGTIKASGGRIVLAAGDLYSMAIEGLDSRTVVVESGPGRVAQFGILNADGVDGDGGSITLTAGDVVALGSDSVTTANAGTNGDGGDVVVYSPDTAIFREGALVEAKGGSESGSGGFFEFSGKKYVEVMGDIDLTAANGRNGMFLIDPLDLWIVDSDTANDDVSEGPLGTWKPIDDTSVSELDIDALEGYLDVADVTLSTIGTPDADGQNGDIIFKAGRNLHSGSYLQDESDATGPSNSSLIVKADHDIIFEAGSNIEFAGDGSVKLYASTRGDSPDYDGAVISEDRGKQRIEGLNIHTAKGDIIIEAGSGGINMGVLQIGTETTIDQEAEIRLSTINGNDVQVDYVSEPDDGSNNNDFDITVQHLNAEGRRFASIYVESAGDLTIDGGPDLDGAVHVKTNTTPVSGAPPASSFICLIADGDIDITGKVFAEATSASESTAGVWIGAGTHKQFGSQDPGYYEGTVTVVGNIQADAKSSGSNGTKQDATIRVYGKFITLNGTVKSVAKNTQYPQPGGQDPDDPYDPTDPHYKDDEASYSRDLEEPRSDGSTPLYDKLESGSRAVVDIDVTVDGSCLNCANGQIQILFDIAPDFYDVDWRAGWTIEGIDIGDLISLKELGILDNDDSDAKSATAKIIILSAANGTLFLDTTGDYPQLKYMPPSYDETFVWDGESQYATFTDIFTYQVEITTEDGTFTSQNFATVTLTVLNEVPTLDDAYKDIHMDTFAAFDLSGLVEDADGTPGAITTFDVTVEDHIADNTYTAEATAGTLTYGYGKVEGTIPLDFGGSILTDSTTLGIDGGTITYTPLPGYVSPDGDPTTFGYSVTDENIDIVAWEDDVLVDVDDAFENADGLEVTVTNELPTGEGWLGTTEMDTSTGSVAFVAPPDGPAGFADVDDGIQTEDDDVSVVGTSFSGAEYLTGDPVNVYGGTLTYDGDDTEGNPQWTYTPDTDNLPGYTGDTKDTWGENGYQADEQFTVKLWDGQNEYQKSGDDLTGDGWVLMQGSSDIWVRPVYSTGTVSVDLTNTLPEGDAWFGQVHMDSQNVTSGVDASGDPVTINFGTGVTVESKTYNGSVIGSDNFGGTLIYDEGTGTWIYSTDIADLPGYVGDEHDDFDNYPVNIESNADDLFTVNLSNGEFEYQFGGVEPEGDEWESWNPAEYEGDPIWRKTSFSDGTVSVDITNALPTIDEDTTIVHMNTDIEGQLFATDQLDSNPTVGLDGLTMLDESEESTTTYTSDFGTTVELTDNSDGTYSYDYESADGYVGEDSVDVAVWDGQINYIFDSEGNIDVEGTSKEIVHGKISIEFTNNKPTADGDLGEAGDPVPQDGVTSPVLVTDIFDSHQTEPDDLSIIPGTYDGDFDGTLEFNGSEWIYTPADGFSGKETFEVDIWDGQNSYDENGENIGRDFGKGTVSVTITPGPEPEPLLPADPRPQFQVPTIEGCPELIQAVAVELGITAETIQIGIGNGLAVSPSIQACDACAKLVDAAAILRDEDGSRMAAMVQMFNELAPAGAPFTPAIGASIAMAFEGAAEGSQYASVMEYIDAFAQYVAVLDVELGSPVGDSVAFVMEKHGAGVMGSDNANIAAYVATRLEAIGQ